MSAATQRPSLPPVSEPAHCWNWTTAEDVVRHALAAFYIACRNTGRDCDSRENWLERMVYAFETRVSADAHELGAIEYPDAAERLSRLTDKLAT